MSDRPLLIRAAKIRSFGPAPVPPAADAILLEQGVITRIGAASALSKDAPGARNLDLPGATLTPGLTDAHIHLTEWGLALRAPELGGTANPAEAAQLVARAEPIAGWIRGRGWSLDGWAGARPHRDILDALLPDTPVALQSHDMHSMWVNSAALRAAGIGPESADPDGGSIERDAHGSATGLLFENAASMVGKALPRPSEEDVVDAVLEAQSVLHSHGFTGVHSMPGIHTPEPGPLTILQQIQVRGRLALRVLQHFPLRHLDDAIRIGMRSGFGGDWIRIGAVKMYLDGTLGSRTAWLREPYDGGSDYGVQVLDTETFQGAVARAAAAGIASAVHAIGDAAVALAIDTLAQPQQQVPALRHRIEHVQCMPFDRLSDIAGITCSVQPCHLINDWSAADAIWGPDRAHRTYAFRALLDAGATLAFGSDAPVEPIDPRRGIHAALNRQDMAGQPAGGWQPEQALTAEEAMRAYTWSPAVAASWSHWLGQIAIGSAADIAAWTQDPADASVPFTEAECVATVVGGDVVFTAD